MGLAVRRISWIEARLNGAVTYNGPKVAKFLVGLNTDLHEWVTRWELSQQWIQ